jgi:hypothetical protein
VDNTQHSMALPAYRRQRATAPLALLCVAWGAVANAAHLDDT